MRTWKIIKNMRLEDIFIRRDEAFYQSEYLCFPFVEYRITGTPESYFRLGKWLKSGGLMSRMQVLEGSCSIAFVRRRTPLLRGWLGFFERPIKKINGLSMELAVVGNRKGLSYLSDCFLRASSFRLNGDDHFHVDTFSGPVIRYTGVAVRIDAPLNMDRVSRLCLDENNWFREKNMPMRLNEIIIEPASEAEFKDNSDALLARCKFF